MRKLIVIAVLLLMAPALAPAQTGDHQGWAQGYAFFGPAIASNRYVTPLSTAPGPGQVSYQAKTGVETGFGAEAFFFKGLGGEAELAYFGPNWSFDNSGLGVGSADLSCRFPIRGSRVEPFAAGGYSLYFGHGENSGYNLGGGVNVWLTRHAALRLGIRYQGNAESLIPLLRHFVAFRVGFTFN